MRSSRRSLFAGFDLLWQTGRMLGLLGDGLLADAVGIQAVYLLGGVLQLCTAAIGALGRTGRTRHWRQQDGIGAEGLLIPAHRGAPVRKAT